MRVASMVAILLTSALAGTGEPLPKVTASYSASAAQVLVAHTSVTTYGLRLSMVVPLLGSLPRSSLLHVRVRVTNVFGHALTLPRFCDRSNPRVVVTNAQGTVVYTTVDT